MRASVKKPIAVALAALALSLATAASATPAAAHPWPHHAFHSGLGFFGAALGLGLLGGVVASQYADDSCIEYHSTFDRWGNYIGRREVNVCN